MRNTSKVMHINKPRVRTLSVLFDRPESVLSTSSEPVRAIVIHGESPVTSKRRASLPTETLINNGPTMTPEANIDLGLRGTAILNFFNMWKYTKPSRPLGKRRVELPDSMTVRDKYRECGCVSSTHVKQCRIRGCCSYK